MEVQAQIRGGLMLLDPHAPPSLEAVGDLILDLDLDAGLAGGDPVVLGAMNLAALHVVGLGDTFQLVFGGSGLLFAAMLRKPEHATAAESWLLPYGAVRMAMLDVLEVERYSPGVSLIGPPPTNIRALESAALSPEIQSLLVQRLVYDDAPVVHGMIGSPGYPALALVPSIEKAPLVHPPNLVFDEPEWHVGDQALAKVRGPHRDGVALRLGSVDSGVHGFLRTVTEYERNMTLRVRLDELRDDGVWRVTPAVVHL